MSDPVNITFAVSVTMAVAGSFLPLNRNALIKISGEQSYQDNVTYHEDAISDDRLNQPTIVRGGESLWP